MITNRSIVSKDEIAFDFIDPLFAVVISLGFESITREPAFFGALRESWLTSPQSIYGTRASFTIAVIGLAYLTVIASWVGYHKSVLAKNIKITTIWGLLRFGADILILGFYWLLLVNYETFRFELYILVLVNVLFVAWDSLKSREYSPESYDSKQRRGVTVIWLLLFTSLYGGYLLFKAQSSLSGAQGETKTQSIHGEICPTFALEIQKEDKSTVYLHCRALHRGHSRKDRVERQ